ncbi:MAG: sugar kinase [Actinobacteria bacterium]|nr:sugar kinase [Actinomycetota bacterium]
MRNETVLCIGDLLVEIMRPNIDDSLEVPGIFLGPYPSGASGVFIDAVARLGIKAGFIGAVGDDDFGKLILNRLRKDDVEISNIKILKDYTTGVAFVTYMKDGNRKFIYHLSRAATGQIYPRDIIFKYVSKFDILHVTGSTISANDNCINSILKAIKIMKSSGGKITFDPNMRIELMTKNSRSVFNNIITHSYIVFPTEEEILGLNDKKNIKLAAQELIDMGPEIVVVKQGERGSTVFTKDKDIYIPPYDGNMEVIDPTGAGDCYCAGFIAGLINGMDLKKSALYANIVGALSITKKGPMEGTPYKEEVDKIFNKIAK